MEMRRKILEISFISFSRQSKNFKEFLTSTNAPIMSIHGSSSSYFDCPITLWVCCRKNIQYSLFTSSNPLENNSFPRQSLIPANSIADFSPIGSETKQRLHLQRIWHYGFRKWRFNIRIDYHGNYLRGIFLIRKFNHLCVLSIGNHKWKC